MNIKDLKNLIPLIILAMVIALFPSFSVGELANGKAIEIRVEDILIVVLGLVWIREIIKKKPEKPPLFWPILIWLGMGLISTLTNLLLGNLILERGFFYFLKEVEFFVLFFYVFYHLNPVRDCRANNNPENQQISNGVKNFYSVKVMTSIWIVLMAINTGYVFFQVLFPPLKGEYGTAALSEWGVFPTGAFFLISFVFLLNAYIYYFLKLNISYLKKGVLGLMVLSPVVGVFGTGSKAALLGLIFAFILTIGLLLFKKTSLKNILLSFLILIIISVGFGIGVKTIPRVKTMFYIFSPINMVKEFNRERIEPSWNTLKSALDKNSPVLYIIGFGKGYVTEAHNQFVRNFVETGIIGFIAFFALIFFILKKAFKGFSESRNNLSLGLSAGLLTATLTMLFIGLTAEVFLVVKPAEVYWFLTALAIFAIQNNE